MGEAESPRVGGRGGRGEVGLNGAFTQKQEQEDKWMTILENIWCFLEGICVFLRVKLVANGCEHGDWGYVGRNFNDSKYEDQISGWFSIL